MEKVTFKNLNEFSHAKKESLRAIKTNLQFCGDDIHVIMFTSSLPDEGKTTITLDMAISFTDSGKKVLLIDTDMRGSVLIGKLKAKVDEGNKISGLSHYLSGQKSLDEVLYETQIPGMSMIFAGPSVPNPTEILDKPYFQKLIDYARENYDYILVDCAPIGAVIDAAVVAKYCDGAVLVVAQGVANSRIIINSKRQLEAAGIRILGVVLNKVKQEKHRYYGKLYGKVYGKYYGKYYGNYYGSYYGSHYGYNTDGLEDNNTKKTKKKKEKNEQVS